MEKIILKNVSKKFKVGFKKNQKGLEKSMSFLSGKEPTKDLWALKNVSLSIKKGEHVAVIGKNGAGKSTLLRVIAGIHKQNKGEVKTFGKIIPIINLVGTFQPRLTMRENIYLCSTFLGLYKKEIEEKYNSIIRLTGLEDFIETKLYQFSSGMVQKLGFAVAVHCNPEILLTDDGLTVADATFRQKIFEVLIKLNSEGCTFISVTHDLTSESLKFYKRFILLDQGKVIKDGGSQEVIDYYKKLIKV